LSAGDDYELCFAVPEARLDAFERVASQWACGFTRIGVVRKEPGLTFEHGALPADMIAGFDHFGGEA
jgi:thiamine monophosphate kinase